VKRFAVLGGVAAILNLVFVTTALGAAPSNDGYAGRTVIGSLPFSDTVDTSMASTGGNDPKMNVEECGAPATDASVWYQHTAATDSALIVDVSASSYSAGVIVATGNPVAGFSFVTCGPGAVVFFAAAGETYTILAFDDQIDGGGNGGTLEITVDTAPPPPTLDITVDPVGQFNNDGSATVSGTVTCIGEAFDTFIEVDLRQRVGRLFISGFGSTSFSCDGTTQAWSVDVFADNGLFKGGRTASVTFGAACGALDCGADFEEATIKLRR
jgi:hypothetical protein